MASDAPTTPQTKSQPLPPDTVPVPRLTSQSSYRTGDLSEGRRAVLEDLTKYLQVPFATLVRSVLGSPPEPLEISQIHKKLTEEGVLSEVQSTSPSKSGLSEAKAYEPLCNMISNILGQVPDCPFSFVAKPSTAPSSSRRNTSRPDAYIVLAHPDTNKKHWFEIAIPFEFKKENNDGTEYDNKQKMIWSLHNIMREDPLRRFTLGITVEETNMRIWYSNRAFLAVSEPVNFIQEIDQVISLFYSIGRKRDVDLGWDPTVERISDETYKFTIGGQFFTTKRPLATYGADAMVGRGTRVYLAVDENGNEVAIKDSWRDKDRDSEGTILKMIFQDIRARFGEEEASNAEKYFVRILVDEDVVISGNSDTTLTPENERDVKWKWIPVKVARPLSTSRHTSSVGHVPDFGITPTAMQRVPREGDTIPCRIHTRTVFKDVGRPLGDINLLADSFSCLSDVQKALYYLHKAGWVHRDFSVANVLWVEQDGRYIGKLSDFEYAKKVGFEISHDVRTGTMHFMAIEVESQSYLFMPGTEPDFPESPTPLPPFRMNYFHDLESQWWAAMWILLYHTDEKSPPEDLNAQLERFNYAFPPFINQTSRRDFFNYPHIRWDTHSKLSVSYKSQCIPVFGFAAALRASYNQAEKSFPIIELSDILLDDIHKKASNAYRETKEQLQESGIRLQTLRNALKRKDSGDSPTNRGAKKARRAE